MIFTFSILHYKAINDTIECIESIRQLNQKCEIVVVNNDENSSDFNILKNKYKKEDVHFIDNNKNIGFASANNLGYKYAKDVLKSDFIAVINNDIVVKSKDIVERFEEKYKRDNFYIAGPDILGKDLDSHQNPMTFVEYKKEELLKRSLKNRLAYYLCKIGFYKLFLRYSNKVCSVINADHNNKQFNIQLQGSFVVYSPSYIKNEDFAFYPSTFLYLEEAILYYYAKAKNYLMAYYPDIKIVHKVGVSTNMIYNTSKKVYMMRLKNTANSLLVLKEVMDKYSCGN